MGDGPAFLDETVPDALDGERIDRALATLVPCSRSEAAEVIGSGGVSIDGTTISKPSTRVGAISRPSREKNWAAPSVASPRATIWSGA